MGSSWWKRFKGEAKVDLLTELESRRLPDGRRSLKTPFHYRIRFPSGELWEDTIPEGTVSDWSSWPNWLHIPIILPRPREEAMDIAGWVHDRVCNLIRNGKTSMSFFEATKFWRYVARSGQGVTRTRLYPSWIGALGLTAWSAWREVWRYRRGGG